MAQNVLSDRKVATAKPRDKEYLLTDGEGLNLRVRPDGSRLWLFRYTSAAGKPAKKSLGPYPSVSLLEARQKAAQMRQQLQKGIDLDRRSRGDQSPCRRCSTHGSGIPYRSAGTPRAFTRAGRAWAGTS